VFFGAIASASAAVACDSRADFHKIACDSAAVACDFQRVLTRLLVIWLLLHRKSPETIDALTDLLSKVFAEQVPIRSSFQPKPPQIHLFLVKKWPNNERINLPGQFPIESSTGTRDFIPGLSDLSIES
jgi:hypothetical protein